MICPKCQHRDTRVIDSRMDREGRSIRRRRVCQNCGHRFSTLEEAMQEELHVRKRDGSRELFDRAKLASGLRKATDKRPIEWEQVEMLMGEVSAQLAEEGPEVATSRIGEVVMEKLRELDHIAYIRFACVYKDFRDIEAFERELSELRG